MPQGKGSTVSRTLQRAQRGCPRTPFHEKTRQNKTFAGFAGCFAESVIDNGALGRLLPLRRADAATPRAAYGA